MNRCFQYKLYPTPEQESLFSDTLETLRHLYNNALAERIDAYKFEQRTLHYEEQANRLPALKKIAEPLAAVFSQVLQDCLKRLQKTYESFLRRVREGTAKPGFPRFKGIGRYRSFTYPQWGVGCSLEGNILHLSKIGDVPVRLHRPVQGTAKTCTISRKADGWYCSLSCEVEPESLECTGIDETCATPALWRDVGIDVGLENFATLSDDHDTIPNPRPLQKAQAKLRIAQRRLERRTRRDHHHKITSRQSQRRERARVLLAKAHQRVQRARLDFHHKTARDLVRQFDILYIESLNIRGMLKNHPLARAIADAGWGQFFLVLKQKAESAAKQVVEVRPRNTSQNCSGCGEYVPKALSCRTHTCPYCGLILHRDKNASGNIRKVGRDAACSRKRSAIAHA